jgi:hypothetical protein
MRRSLSGALNRVKSLADLVTRQCDAVDWEKLAERLASVRQEGPPKAAPPKPTPAEDEAIKALMDRIREAYR